MHAVVSGSIPRIKEFFYFALNLKLGGYKEQNLNIPNIPWVKSLCCAYVVKAYALLIVISSSGKGGGALNTWYPWCFLIRLAGLGFISCTSLIHNTTIQHFILNVFSYCRSSAEIGNKSHSCLYLQ